MILKTILAIVAVAVLSGLLFIAYEYWQVNRNYLQPITLQGLSGKITISRNSHAVPYIVAEADDLDTFYGLGYIHALDRFWQMEFQRHVGAGRLSEIFGEKALEQDKYLRTWGFYRAAAAAWPAFDDKTKRIIRAYTAGINAYLNTQKMPLQIRLLRYRPQPWTEIDSIIWQKMMAWDLQDSWQDKVENFLIALYEGEDKIALYKPPYPENAATVLTQKDLQQSDLLAAKKTYRSDYTASIKVNNYRRTAISSVIIDPIRHGLGYQRVPGKGSNAWVVSGKFSENGKPLLANDLHLSLSAPSLWYLASLQGPNLHVIGATLPGIPGVVVGRNQHIAWGLTNAEGDPQDLYVVTDDMLTTVTEIIKVQGKPDVEYQFEMSRHGPVISNVTVIPKELGKVALKWVALEPNDTSVQSLLNINYAQNWPEFKAALKDYVTPSQNFFYADRQGNIGYYLAGKLPIRQNWSGALPIAADQDHEWSGYIPFTQLPHVYNPPEGYIASGNNKSVPDSYPYEITFRWHTPPWRIARILDLLSQDKQLNTEKMKMIQTDTYSYYWQALRSILLSVKPVDQASHKALLLLNDWDGNMDKDSTAATVFAYWTSQLRNLTPSFLRLDDTWVEPLFIIAQLQTEGQADFLSQSLQQAMQHLTAQYGSASDNWRWGKMHRALFKNLGFGEVPWLAWLWDRKIAASGGNYTVNAGTFNADTFIQTKGASYRQLVDLSDLSNSWYIQPLGQSGNLLNKHYADLMKLWRDGQYIPMH